MLARPGSAGLRPAGQSQSSVSLHDTEVEDFGVDESGAEYGLNTASDATCDTDTDSSGGVQHPARASSAPPPLHRLREGGHSAHSGAWVARPVLKRRKYGRGRVQSALTRWEQRLKEREAELTAQAAALQRAHDDVRRLMLRVKAQAARTLADAADVESRRLEVSRLAFALRQQQQSLEAEPVTRPPDSARSTPLTAAAMPARPAAHMRRGSANSANKASSPGPLATPSRRAAKTRNAGIMGMARRVLYTVVYILVSGAIFLGVVIIIRPPPAIAASRMRTTQPVTRVTTDKPHAFVSGML